jgi:cellulose synthase (UDP-forming)
MSGPKKKPGPGLLVKLLILLSIVVLGLLASVRFEWQDQALFGIFTFLLAVWINRRSGSYSGTLLLVVLSLFSTFRYGYWRYSETFRHLSATGFTNLSWDVAFPLLLLLAETYAIAVLTLGYFQSLRPLDRNPTPLPRDLDEWPLVDVYVPTYNEPLDVVMPTVLAAMRMDWPPEKMNVFILDDGRREEFREFAEACSCGYMVRSDNKGAKAGNINRAMEQTSGEFIAIFDCDHIPTRSFLQMTMGWFLKDPDLAMVQTPHYFYTPDPFEKNLDIFGEVPNEGALFYGVVQNCNDFWNATFFCGSCAAIRRTALMEVGGIAVETVTEDAHTALKMQRRGWNTAYIRFPQAAGLATASLADHIGQRIRWARGMVQILRIDCPLFGRGLTWPQRLCYLNSTMHYLYAIPRLIFLTAPLVYLLLNRSNVYGYVATILAYAFPHIAQSTLTNSRIQGRYRHSFWNEVYETVLAPYILIPTTLALISPKHGKFNVTPKSQSLEHSYFSWHAAWPVIVLLLLNAGGIALGGLRLMTEPERQPALLMNMFWALLNVMILGASVAVAAERRQRRTEARLERRYPARLILEDGRVLSGETDDMSNSGVAFRLDEPAELPEAGFVTLLVTASDEEAALPVEIVGVKDRLVRMRFHDLEMHQRDAITRMIFAGADLWLTGLEAKTFDRPGQSFFRILRVAVRGIMLIPAAMFARAAEPAPATPLPPPRRARSRARQTTHTTLTLLLAAALGLGIAARQSYAADKPATPAFEEVRDFRLLGERQPIVLRGTDVQAALNFSLPLAKVATEARLGLNYQLSPQLDASKSELQVVLNGSYVGSIPLEQGGAGADAFSHAELAIPAELLIAQNTLTFQLKGQCAGACSGTEADYRTLIDLSSSLRIAGEIIPWPNELSLLPAPFFDPNLQQAVELAFVLPPGADAQILKAAGLVASYFGALADHRRLRYPVSRAGLPKGNIVVFAVEGSADLAALKMDVPAGPVVALRDNPADDSGKVLVLGGRDSSQVLQAAEAFARGLAATKGDLFALHGVSPAPVRRPYDAPRWLRSGQLTRVGDSTSDEQLRVEGSGVVRWYFRLPPDLYFGSREGVPMRLHYRYTPLPSDSRAEVRIKINGVDVATRRFGGGKQAESVHDTVEIPVAALYPRNTLTLEFKAIDSGSHRSAPTGSLLRDSELDLRGVPHFATLPRLDLFAKAGFPFTRMADLSGSAVVLPERPSPEELRAYLELIGFLSAQTGLPGLQVEILDPQQALRAGNKDLLVIGTAQSMPLFSTWGSLMPLKMDKSGLTLNQPDSMWLRLLSIPVTSEGREWRKLNDRLSGEAVSGLVLQGFVSPLNPQRSVVAISATSPAAFEQLVDALDRSIQDEEVYGTVSLQTAKGFDSYRLPTANYSLGEMGWRAAMDYWVYRYMWFVPLIVLLIGLFLASITSGWVERHAEERLRIES